MAVIKPVTAQARTYRLPVFIKSIRIGQERPSLNPNQNTGSSTPKPTTGWIRPRGKE